MKLRKKERARARLAVFRFDDLLGDDYYAFRRGDPNRLDRWLAGLLERPSAAAELEVVRDLRR